MSLAASLLLASVAAQAPSASLPSGSDRGAQVETAKVSVTILRPAVVKGGALVESRNDATPHNQRRTRDGRVTYEFE